LVVGFRAGLHVFDGDFYNEFSATDILLGPGDLCSHVILVERRHFDVHAFCCHQSLSSEVRSYTTFARKGMPLLLGKFLQVTNTFVSTQICDAQHRTIGVIRGKITLEKW